MKHFHLASQAQIDLDDIWLFIAEDSPDAADRFHDLSPYLYSFVTGNYVIFYRDTPEHIEIVRVLHGARDIENIF